MWREPFLHVNIPTMNASIFRYTPSSNLDYLCLGRFQIHWILVTDWNNSLVTIRAAPISTLILSWGTDALLLIMCAIINTNDLSKSVWLWDWWRLCPQHFILERRVGATSVSNNHNLVDGSCNWMCALSFKATKGYISRRKLSAGSVP